MNVEIITKELAEQLSSKHKFMSSLIIDPKKFKNLHAFFVEENPSDLIIYDRTRNKTHKGNTIIPVKDHINRTGNNPLIGRQSQLGFDFIDITNLYNYSGKGVITDCCGEALNNKYDYPSHYLCNISVLARAVGIKRLQAFLYNIL